MTRARDVGADSQTHHRGRDVAACYGVAGRRVRPTPVCVIARPHRRDAASTLAVVTTHVSLGPGTRV